MCVCVCMCVCLCVCVFVRVFDIQVLQYGRPVVDGSGCEDEVLITAEDTNIQSTQNSSYFNSVHHYKTLILPSRETYRCTLLCNLYTCTHKCTGCTPIAYLCTHALPHSSLSIKSLFFVQYICSY